MTFFKKYINRYSIIIFLFSLITLYLTYSNEYYYDKDFLKGILVEVNGVFIELIIIVILYTYYKKTIAQKEKAPYLNEIYLKLYQSITISLDDFSIEKQNCDSTIMISWGNSDLPSRPIEKFYSIKYFTSEIQKEINKEEDIDFIKKGCDNFLNTFEENQNFINNYFDIELKECLNLAKNSCTQLLININEQNNKNLSISKYATIFELIDALNKIIKKSTNQKIIIK